MKDQWQDQVFAQKWDRTNLAGNPTRIEQLDILLSVVKQEYRTGKAILDLGIGSGQVAEMIFANRPEAYIVGIDYSSVMLDIAHQRLRSFSEQYTIIQHDFLAIQELSLPQKPYQIAISVQSLHHIPHQSKKELFGYVYSLLEDDGIFLLADRVAIDVAHLSHTYIAVWERLERLAEFKSGWSGEYFLQRLQNKEDHPAALEEHLAWLCEVGFYASCLHLHLDRAVMVAVKKES
jgi:ubiquinone/menaquinone biosynthesis C-methylase UbiE